MENRKVSVETLWNQPGKVSKIIRITKNLICWLGKDGKYPIGDRVATLHTTFLTYQSTMY
ncbi:MAG: hypothetical protein SAK29_25075 [Scytonema sp. PMC 1069.18]|nr:hypothetical protein [Scytonema sp. PMC 1069.18]MEC4886475.1 hypothetical protein [Scytonema sp. PMC 1070.18]